MELKIMKTLHAQVRIQRWAFSPRGGQRGEGALNSQASDWVGNMLPESSVRGAAHSPGSHPSVWFREPGGAGRFIPKKAGFLHPSPAHPSEWVAARRLGSPPASGKVPGMRAPLFKYHQAVTQAAPHGRGAVPARAPSQGPAHSFLGGGQRNPPGRAGLGN